MSRYRGRHVMVDLETLSLGKDATITQIGACAFYPETGEVSQKERILLHVRMGSCMAMGRSVDPDTILWWMDQNWDARRSFIQGQKEALDLPPALLELSEFCSQSGGRRGLGNRPEPPAGVWSHGLTMDVAILEDAYNRCGLKEPWPYQVPRDTRTIFGALTSEEESTVFGERWEDHVAHRADDDAVKQAYRVLHSLHVLGWGPPVQRFDPNAGLPPP